MRERDHVERDIEMGEFMMLGMRLRSGISKREFARRFGTSLSSVYGPAIDDLVSLGLVRSETDSVALTERGMLLGNEVFARFV